MFDCRNLRNGHSFAIERNAVNGMYRVTLRSGVTMLHARLFDTGRDAWRAFRLSPERFMSDD